MITFDGSNAGYCFASKPNWRAVGEFAISDLMPGRPVLSYQMYSQQALDSAERSSKEYMLKSRASMWSMLGPECGPEVCAEPGCDRLRIQLAMRCFLHQLL